MKFVVVWRPRYGHWLAWSRMFTVYESYHFSRCFRSDLLKNGSEYYNSPFNTLLCRKTYLSSFVFLEYSALHLLRNVVVVGCHRLAVVCHSVNLNLRYMSIQQTEATVYVTAVQENHINWKCVWLELWASFFMTFSYWVGISLHACCLPHVHLI